MSERSFKFVSPGVFVNEIDNSQIPALPGAVGPVIIGRTERGPGMRPVKVNSFSEYIENFGNPIAGGLGDDVYRYGNYTSPTYASYAAQAYLRNGETATIIRLLGAQHKDNTGASAAKAGWNVNSIHASQGSGTYGLFIFPSGSAATMAAKSTEVLTGTLAAIWHFNSGAIVLSGTRRVDEAGVERNASVLTSVSDDWGFKAVIKSQDTFRRMVEFNFNPTSEKFIRKVFNTNPILTNSTVTSGEQEEFYFLAQSHEGYIKDNMASSSAGKVYGFIAGLKAGSATDGDNFKFGYKSAQSNWIISQDLGDGTKFDALSTDKIKKLFRFHGRDGGEWDQRSFKISIQDIIASKNTSDPFGSFTVVVRDIKDNDSQVRVMEKFANCNLNPNSPNYLAFKIGDMYTAFDDTERRMRDYGTYPNKSKFIRVEMNPDADNGQLDPQYIPFGFWGPYRFKSFLITSGCTKPFIYHGFKKAIGPASDNRGDNDNAFLTASRGGITGTYAAAGRVQGTIFPLLDTGHYKANGGKYSNYLTAAFHFPTVKLRSTSNDSTLALPKQAYWGFDSRKKDSDEWDPSNIDALRALPGQLTPGDWVENAFAFTMDDIKVTGTHATYSSGSRAAGTSYTYSQGSASALLDKGFNRFTVPMFGGFDGLDITESDPFRNSVFGSTTETTSYTFNTVKRAIDTAADPDKVECNLIAVPGITKAGLTDHLLNRAADRADCLAVIDLPDVYIPRAEGTGYANFADRLGTVDSVVNALRDRGLNNSYGCTYYPWVQIRDTLNGSLVWAPPSVVALGTFASSQKKSELWFAPAGFVRGGLTQGTAGVPVIGITERLSSDQRDELYNANINPIASFPAEGIVIFGQKTLQVTQSALDRINVRRLLIYVKREISRIARSVLFEQNVKVTWNAFISKAEPLLRSVKTRLGLTDFKLVLDETTTTPDLIDRNIMYAKIYLKPARAIEFIALDFIITRTGASFED